MSQHLDIVDDINREISLKNKIENLSTGTLFDIQKSCEYLSFPERLDIYDTFKGEKISIEGKVGTIINLCAEEYPDFFVDVNINGEVIRFSNNVNFEIID